MIKGEVVATHMESEDIEALPVIPYLGDKGLRSRLESGDLLFASGDYLVSRAIQLVTKSPWSHVGIVFKLDDIDKMLLLESVEDMGVRFAPLSKYLSDYEDGKPYKGRVVIGRCKGVDTDIVKSLAKLGINELTCPYDKDEVAKILARVILRFGKKERNREYICSELVYECFLSAGIEFGLDELGFISPENIWCDEKVSRVDRIL